MKKSIIILTTATLLAAMPAAAAAGGGYYRHGHYGGYYGDVWAGIGIGLLTGVVLSAIFYPPPQRTVVYQAPAPVVVQPAPVVVTPYRYGYDAAGSVSVRVELLNLRSGPALYQTVIGRLRQGDVLTVIGTSPGWLNVRTPSGAVGWVMARYTASPVG